LANSFRVDTHHHVIPAKYRAALSRAGSKGSGERGLPDWSPDLSLQMMDKHEIEYAVASVGSPGTYFGDQPYTDGLARTCNEALADLRASHPKRFGAFASLPLPDIPSALKELEFALDVLKLDGVAGFSHVAHRYVGHAEESELYAELNRRGAIVFLHPLRCACVSSGLMAQYSFAAGYTELVFDTTRAIFNMFYNGIFERYPQIRFIVPHCGGTAPFLQYRMQEVEELPIVRKNSPRGMAHAMKSLYYDVALSAAPVPLSALLQVADPTHILFGSDFPFAINTEKAIADTVTGVSTFAGFDALGLRRGVERDNARRLFKLSSLAP
jgi:predicted TIM-barrel fold metal-dependent hydrolase